jgi:carbonic anhydrase
MERLIEGFRRFRREDWPRYRELFETLGTHGQSPRAMVIACSDSRVDPQMLFSAAPGELFTVRNVANLVPPYAPDAAYHGTSAALEFAVRTLRVDHVVVLGHERCGGITSLLRSPRSAGDFVGSWMQIAAPARERALAVAAGDDDALQLRCEHEAIKVSIENLQTFPWLRERVTAGNLVLHGCWFEIVSGTLMRLVGDGTFQPVLGA